MLEETMLLIRWLLKRGLWLVLTLSNGWLLWKIARPFLSLRKQHWWQAILLLLFAGCSGMVIWVGDPNLLYTLPVFLLVFLLCTKGNRVGRLAMALVFFCLVMSVCALLDTYMRPMCYNDVLTRLARPLAFGGLYLFLRSRLPTEPVHLSHRLWQLVLGLSVMPFCALTAVVLLTHTKYDSPAAYTQAMTMGIVVLPFVLLTSVMLLRAVLVLADHERLEQAGQLAGLREVYYQGLRQQERQIRTLRHDLRNHLTVIRGLLMSGDTENAIGYLEQIAGSPALRGTKRLCENEAANAVLSAKVEAMEREGLRTELTVSLPAELPVEDVDLCALLGNALDNAAEGACGAGGGTVTVRCRADKGLLMLRVVNPVGKEVRPDLSTTKADKLAHGFGIPGMREIAERYGGTLEAGARNGQFELVVCLPLKGGVKWT